MKALNLQGTSLPLADANGNCVSFIDEAGNVQSHYTYDAFGNTVSQSGAMADDFPFRFSSKYLDVGRGCISMGSDIMILLLAGGSPSTLHGKWEE